MRARFAKAVSDLKASGRPVAVLGHLRPDGDCIGAQVALCRFLLKEGIPALCVNAHPVPRTMQELVAVTPFATGMQWLPENHLAVTVDCSDNKRYGDRLGALLPEVFLQIDHHLSNKGFARYDIVDSDASATCEILARLLLPLDGAVDAVTAQALYVGIATDTGQFEYPSTTAQVFDAARELIARGADPAKAARELYERESFGKIRLLQKFLKTLTLEFEGKACIGILRQADYEQTGTTREDSDGFVNYPRSIQNVEIAAVLDESADMIKASLRARNPAARVDLLAGLFSGGGHAAAAGFTRKGESLEHFYPIFLKALEQHLHKYCL